TRMTGRPSLPTLAARPHTDSAWGPVASSDLAGRGQVASTKVVAGLRPPIPARRELESAAASADSLCIALPITPENLPGLDGRRIYASSCVRVSRRTLASI